MLIVRIMICSGLPIYRTHILPQPLIILCVNLVIDDSITVIFDVPSNTTSPQLHGESSVNYNRIGFVGILGREDGIVGG